MYTPMCADDYMKAWEAVNPEYREAAIVLHMDTLSNKLNRLCNELEAKDFLRRHYAHMGDM